MCPSARGASPQTGEVKPTRASLPCFPPSYGLLWAEGLLKLLERWKLNQPAKEMKAISLTNHRGPFHLRVLAVPVYQAPLYSLRQFIIVLLMNTGTS